jgi:putative ABC transport system permease protein
MEIDLLYREGAPVDEVVGSVRRILKARHGRDDFTIVTQQEMLDVLGSVLGVLTFAVGALGGISLFVGCVGILTIMTISVRERTAEIGLLRALGATKRSILVIFLGETILLAAAGGLAGLFAGAVGAQALHAALPALPVKTTWSYAVAAEALAVVIGLMAGILPARRAANFDPVEALRAE